MITDLVKAASWWTVEWKVEIALPLHTILNDDYKLVRVDTRTRGDANPTHKQHMQVDSNPLYNGKAPPTKREKRFLEVKSSVFAETYHGV